MWGRSVRDARQHHPPASWYRHPDLVPISTSYSLVAGSSCASPQITHHASRERHELDELPNPAAFTRARSPRTISNLQLRPIVSYTRIMHASRSISTCEVPMKRSHKPGSSALWFHLIAEHGTLFCEVKATADRDAMRTVKGAALVRWFKSFVRALGEILPPGCSEARSVPVSHGT